jgi:hypothetical protein
LFARVLHVSWRSLPSGIALGFAISASNELAADVSLSAFGRGYYVNVDLARMVAFHMCVLVWFFYISGPERIAFTGKRLTRTDLELWNEELQRMVGR